jgi:hypothetical protein
MQARMMKLAGLVTLAAATLLGSGCGGSGGKSMPPPPAANTAPVISAITDRSASQDTAVTVDFGIDDRESGAGSLTVSAMADGTMPFPDDGVVLSGSGAQRTLTLTPLEAVTGTATVTLNVVDPQGAVATRSFQVTVNARDASLRDMALQTFAKGEGDEPTMLNGWTIQQDADDPAVFAALVPAGDE